MPLGHSGRQGLPAGRAQRERGRANEGFCSLASRRCLGQRPPRQEIQVPVAAESFGPLVAKATLILRERKNPALAGLSLHRGAEIRIRDV
jgi:hypothetical protein